MNAFDSSALTRILAACPDVRLAVLFGSTATGRARPDSDVDIAVLLEGDPSLAWELALQATLETIAGRPVDLVRIDRASPVVRWEIARAGVRLHESAPGAFRRFRVAAAIEHDELAPQFARAAETYRRAVLAGRGPGSRESRQ